MAKFAFTQQINYATLKLNDFLGVDFQNDASEVSLSRSPDALNVVSSNNSTIEKRPGFEVLKNFVTGIIHSVHVTTEVVETLASSVRPVIYAHIGTELWSAPLSDLTAWVRAYNYTNELETTRNVVTPSYVVLSATGSMFVETSGGLYIFSGMNVFKRKSLPVSLTDTTKIAFVDVGNNRTKNDAYIPTTVIARTPEGGGKSYEAINLFQTKRKNSFLSNGIATVYQLDATLLDALVVTDSFGFSNINQVSAELLQTNGLYTTLTEAAGLTVNRSTGFVTFTVAPPVSPIIGQDNVILTFSKTILSKKLKSIANPGLGYFTFFEANIAGVKKHAFFGMMGADDYVFLGGVELGNKDYRSRSIDMYMPDTGYTVFGKASGVIAGYSRIGDNLAVHCSSETDVGQIYLRSVSLDTDNELIFPVKQGVFGVDHIDAKSFQTLRGEPIFLTKSGVMGLVSNNVADVQSIQSRGHFIDNRLLSEANLTSAVSCIYDNKYMIFINGKVYVCDSRRKFSEKDAVSESYQYEWYYWGGIAVNSVSVHDGVLYFGTSDGKLCRMRKKGGANAHYDNDVPVSAYWCTPVLFMGDVTIKKSLKNLWIRMEQYSRSGIKVFYRSREQITLAKEITFDTFNFENIDFNRLTFETDVDAEIIVTNRVARQFSSIQFKFQSDKAENIGLIEVVAKYRANSAFKGG